MKRIFLGLGTNLGDREAQIRTAITHLNASNIQVIKLSPVYETEPEGFREQPLFLNAVVEAETELLPIELLSLIKKIESLMKRKVTRKNGPRTIDIDILFYESEVVRLPGLQIPHPRLRERRFVLAPLADLAPDWRDPVTQRTIAELLAALTYCFFCFASSASNAFWRLSI